MPHHDGMTSAPAPQAPEAPPAGVQGARPIELFFDLVFVFAVTQLSGVVAHPAGPDTYVQAALMFLSLMWMYDGYVWLSSNLSFDGDLDSWLYFLAMAGFLVMAVGIPDVRGAGGRPFGLGLLLVTVIHTVMFARVPNASARAILGIAPFNVASAALVLASTFASGALHWALWIGGVGVLLLATVTRREQAFELSPRHFVERHGLLILITLGESVMGLGLGVRGLVLDGPRLIYLLLGLLLAAHLWWGYFGPNHDRAEHHFISAAPERRNRMALLGFGYLHMAMMAGIILFAAAVEVGVHEPAHHAPGVGAWNLAAGLALFYAGHVAFRRVMAVGSGWLRVLISVLCGLSVILGLTTSALGQLVACAAVIVVITLLEDYAGLDRGATGSGAETGT